MHLSPIEYIGTQPRKPKRNSLKTFIISATLLSLGAFGLYKYGASDLFAAQNDHRKRFTVEEYTSLHLNSDTQLNKFLAAAINRTTQSISYDPKYYEINFPLGDIPKDKGVCSDVIIRTYRAIGIDLQEMVYDDMVDNYQSYPKNWNLSKPDPNIDHRRVPNLKNFFSRNGVSLPLSDTPSDYKKGDIVVWKLSHGAPHIGIVVPSPIESDDTPWIVHNVGLGPQWQNCLFDYDITGHYRFKVD